VKPRASRCTLPGAAVAAACTLAALAAARIPEVDAWWQVQYGRFLLRHGSLPRVDIWSWTVRGHPVMVTEWVFDAAMGLAAGFGGWGGLGLALACLVPLGLAILRLYGRLARDPQLAGLVAVLLLGLLLPFLGVLPQLASYALFAGVWWALEAARLGGPRPLVLLPPLFGLWANVHGTFPLGWGLVALDTVLSRRARLPGRLRARYHPATRRWLPVATLAAGAATLLNPYGRRLLPYEGRLATSRFHLQHIAEYQSPNFHSPYLAWAVLPAVGLALLLAAGTRRRPPARELVAAVVLLAGGLVMVRMLPYALVALGALASAALRGRRRAAAPLRAPQALAILACLAVGFWRLPPRSWPVAEGMPVQAAAFVRTHLAGLRGFNTYEWGGFLLATWDGSPGVYVDSRGDLYDGTAVLGRYVAIVELQADPGPALAAQGVGWALLPVGSRLDLVLRLEGWRIAYRDAVAEVLLPAAAG
jgi:hypothetical protein